VAWRTLHCITLDRLWASVVNLIMLGGARRISLETARSWRPEPRS